MNTPNLALANHSMRSAFWASVSCGSCCCAARGSASVKAARARVKIFFMVLCTVLCMVLCMVCADFRSGKHGFHAHHGVCSGGRIGRISSAIFSQWDVLPYKNTRKTVGMPNSEGEFYRLKHFSTSIFIIPAFWMPLCVRRSRLAVILSVAAAYEGRGGHAVSCHPFVWPAGHEPSTLLRPGVERPAKMPTFSPKYRISNKHGGRKKEWL